MKLRLIIGGSGQGKRAYAESSYNKADILPDFHLLVREWINAKKTPCEEYAALLHEWKQKDGELVILSTEIGCGIVPMEETERLWREETGRLLCQIAADAVSVERMICGLPQRIK